MQYKITSLVHGLGNFSAMHTPHVHTQSTNLFYFLILDPSDCNSQKVDGAHARLENAFNKMMDKIDKDVIRQNYVS